MAKRTPVGAKVPWRWGRGEATGRIVELFDRPVSRTFKGKRVRRNGNPDDPACLIEQEDGARVLKLRSELVRA